ncbi:MAG: hypothetical protein ACK4RK_12255 [Gemmataceae bacterium]
MPSVAHREPVVLSEVAIVGPSGSMSVQADEGQDVDTDPMDAGPAVVAAAVPIDPASQLIAETLRLREEIPRQSVLSEDHPLTLPGHRSVEKPELPLMNYQGNVVPATSAPSGQVFPRSLPEEAPLRREMTDQTAPTSLRLPTRPLVRVPAPDMETPLAVPLLSGPALDRGPLTDATQAASRGAVLAQPLPPRTGPAPANRPRLPDPFIHQKDVELKFPLPEPPPKPLLFLATPPIVLPVEEK